MSPNAQSAGSGLIVQDLTRDYATRGDPLHVLRGVNLHLGHGEALAITGPSGSGKSTLLHIIGTLDKPTDGMVLLDDRNPFELREHELAAFRNGAVGFVFQDHYLLPQCNIMENVLLPTVLIEDSDEDFEARARQLLDRVGLSNRLDHRPAELSGGERQRAAVARALINRPTLLLCDEPTGNLDRASAQAVGDVLLEVAASQQATLIVVTHSMELAGRFPRRTELVEGVLEPR